MDTSLNNITKNTSFHWLQLVTISQICKICCNSNNDNNTIAKDTTFWCVYPYQSLEITLSWAPMALFLYRDD